MSSDDSIGLKKEAADPCAGDAPALTARVRYRPTKEGHDG
jgi:hypothetical protein